MLMSCVVIIVEVDFGIEVLGVSAGFKRTSQEEDTLCSPSEMGFLL